MSDTKQIRFVIVSRETEWYLGPNRSIDDPVGRWYADTPLAFSFLSIRGAVEKLAEHILTCQVGVLKDERVMTCYCKGARVQPVLWPSAKPVENV